MHICRSSLDQARLDLAQTKVLAPFSGRIIRTFVAPGDRVLPGVPLIQVADQDGVEVRTSVSATLGRMLRHQLKQGKTINATALIDAKQMRFTLTRISGDIKAGQSGLDAFFSPDFVESLDIGQVVSLSITLPEEQNVIVLPIQSIYENNRIYRVEENRLVGINIEEVGDYVEANGHYRLLVRSEKLAAGDLLVTTQLPRAITALLVEPIDTDPFVDVAAQ